MTDDLTGWIRLTLIPGVGSETRRILLKAFGLPECLFASDRSAIAAVVGPELADRLLYHDCQAAIDAALAWAQEPANHILTLADADYPQSLLTSDDPPVLLYLKGQIDCLNQPMLGIVGSRNATAQGERDAEAFAKTLTQAGLTIVSGLALGIDAAAHRGALLAGGKTVAVIGTGADRMYPARNASLGRGIVDSGVIVSEFPLGTPALAANFPRRNRLIAGMGLGCLVVEAAPKSGSLITARLAAEAGREVFAIPGSIHSPMAKGCHQLIRQGAKLVESAEDVLEELRWKPIGSKTIAAARVGTGDTVNQVTLGDTVNNVATPTPTPQEEQILTLLGTNPCNLESLSAQSHLTPGELLAMLLPMELAGRIAQLPGGLYQRLH